MIWTGMFHALIYYQHWGSIRTGKQWAEVALIAESGSNYARKNCREQVL
jgi:hypothetical protein